MLALLLLATLPLALAAAAPPCSLNGVPAADGACACDPPWLGPLCETLDERPGAVAYGADPTLFSWGGNAVVDAAGTFHLYVAEMEGYNCSLSTWQRNSACVHATAPSAMGPFQRQGVAVDAWCHNPQVLALRDGTLALFHIGAGTTGGNVSNCSSGDISARSPAVGPGSTLHVSATPDGPWVPSSHPPPTCNNPAPLLHPNGTFYLLCDSTTILSSPSIDGPWTHVLTWDPESGGGPYGGYEDAFIWIDRRGSWHSLFHVWSKRDLTTNSTQCATATVSAHAYSEDGLQWYVGASQPYNTTVAFVEGPTEISPTRERPKLFFAADGVTPAYLFNGAVVREGGEPCASPWCSSCKMTHKTYTLVVPLGHDGDA
jgi:hypothetical protein